MRKEEIFTIEDDGREITFAIKQMGALRLERFINKGLILLAKAAGKDVKNLSMNTLNRLGDTSGKGLNDLVKLLCGLNYEEIEPLYNELLDCCYILPDPSNPAMRQQCTPMTIEGNIENPLTLYKLRMEALKVNFSFFQNAVNSPADQQGISFPKLTKTSRR